MILLSQISSNQCPIDNTHGTREAHQEAADTPSTCGIARHSVARQPCHREVLLQLDYVLQCVQAKSAASRDTGALCRLEGYSRRSDEQATQGLGPSARQTYEMIQRWSPSEASMREEKHWILVAEYLAMVFSAAV
jgi:hypothetical protein